MSKHEELNVGAYIGGCGIVLVITIILLFGSIFTIDAGHTGLILRGGKVVEVVTSGFNTKTPFLTSVEKIDNRRQKVTVNTDAYTKDQQPISLSIDVTYYVPADKSQELYTNYLTIENVINRAISPSLGSIKNTVGKFNALGAVTDRARLSLEISETLIKAIQDVTDVVKVESVILNNIDFSDAYERAVEERMQAEVEATKREQELAQMKIQAEIIKTEAEAKSYAVKKQGEAEAYALRLKADVLANSKNLVALTAAEKWNGVTPTYAGNVLPLPILDVK
jgi:regulator of protease activity HflC (stomatin/prohibitin superfamily)